MTRQRVLEFCAQCVNHMRGTWARTGLLAKDQRHALSSWDDPLSRLQGKPTFCKNTSASTDAQLSRPCGMGYWSPGVTRSAEVTGALAATATAAMAAAKSTVSIRFDLRG